MSLHHGSAACVMARGHCRARYSRTLAVLLYYPLALAEIGLRVWNVAEHMGPQ